MTQREQLLLAGLGLAALAWALSRTRTGEAAIAQSVEYAGEAAGEVIEQAQAALDWLTRGERNNNPGNIERTSEVWQGMAPDQSGDVRFVVFSDPVYGIRALGRVLLTKWQRGLRNVTQLVSSWAPAPENLTGAYIADVADRLNVPANQALDLAQPGVLTALAAAIIHHENGRVIYPPDQLAAGVQMAYAGRNWNPGVN